MAEILVLWMLGLIVISIAWGGIDKIAGPIKTLAQSFQTPELSKHLQIAVASLFALAMVSIMAVAVESNDIEEWVGLPMMLIWAGGLWLIPFRFDAGHYWLSAMAIGVILALFWFGNISYHSTRTYASTDSSIQQVHVSIQQTDVSAQQGQETSTRVTGLGFLFWIVLIGLTVAAIARYTSTWNAAALNS